MEAITTVDDSTSAHARGWRARLRRILAVHPWLRRHWRALATVLIALAGAWLALVAAGTTQGFVGPLAVDASVRPSVNGESIIEVDPIGTLVLDTHRGPIALHVAVRSVDVDGVRELVDDPSSLTTIDDQIVGDLRGVLIEAAVRAAALAVIGAALASGLLMRSVRYALLGAATAVVAVVATYGTAAATFNQEAVREPSYTGLLQTAPQLVGSAEDIASNFDAYADQLASIVTNVGALYDTTLSLPTFQPDDDTIRLLHVSDLHLNPAAWEVIDAVADQYDVDVIVDSGDIADHGTPIESGYVQPIGALERPYVYVRGNHDSVATEAAVAAQPNAIVLNGEPVEVAGLRFIGAPDPRFTPDQSTRGTANEDILRGTEELAAEASDLDPPADVIVYHDPTHAEIFDGAAPLVLAGHAHRRTTYVLDDGTRVMVQGSTGGAGLRALEKEEPTPVTLSVLYFDPESTELVAWDDLTLGGLGLTSAQIERHQTDEDDGTAKRSTDPSPTPGLEN
ncbi:MAG TPA: metallophosphoesterase [Jiangellaceae bacterium]